MRIYFALLTMALHFTAMAQEVIEGREAPIHITPVYHATMVIEWDGTTVFVDPYGGAERLSAFEPADLILITHRHPDHFDPETLVNLEYESAEIIAPETVMSQMDTMRFKKKTVMHNGQTVKNRRIKITAVPMYNLPQGGSARHEKGAGNGYLLEMDGQRIYISGDTEGIPEMRDLSDIDVAFVCMNLPYTMDIEQAADAVLAFKPEVVYPYHYRGKEGFSDVEQFKEIVNLEDPSIEVRLRDWYPEKPE